jgi:hypothetical protein
MSREHPWRQWVVVLGRSILVGAASGLLGGALIFFFFGFIGFSGASLPTRIENGWEAAIDPGLRKGIAAGLAIAMGLAGTLVLWSVVGGQHHPSRTRKWLSVLAIISVVASNLDSLRTPFGWDPVGLGTVLGIGLLVAGVVWAVAPWVLQSGISEFSRDGEPVPGRGLHHG